MSRVHAPPARVKLPAEGVNLAVVATRFNADVVDGLLAGCFAALSEHGVDKDQVRVLRAPGVFELPQTVAWLLDVADPTPHAIIALGAVIRGETLHYELLAAECVRGLSSIAMMELVPVTLGVLTVDNIQQAQARSTPGDVANRGYQAALAALEMITLQAGGG